MSKKPKKKSNQELVEAYLQDAEIQGLTEDTRSAYRLNLNAFLEFLGKKSCLKVGVPELRDYLAHERRLGFKPATLRVHFSAISSFYDYLVFDQYLPGNPVPSFRKRYFTTIRRDASKDQSDQRQVLSVQDMRRLLHSITDVRDRAFLTLLTKTGARREEIVAVDVEEVDWVQQSIRLKPHPKRTNLIVFFDDEAARTLRRWIAIRQARGAPTKGALFTGDQGRRLVADQASKSITDAAQALGLHDPEGSLDKRFTPHCCRHFFTTHLLDAGMKREQVAWLRGDAPKGTIDIYNRIDPAKVREAYRARVPQFGL